jgi:uncharacterized protein DUF4124
MIDSRILPAILTLLVTVPTHASVYKCVDSNGSVTYTNDRTLGRGCKELSEDQPVSSMPAPSRPPASAPRTSPSDFPRVAPDAQRSRDDTRRQVLEKELHVEETALADAKKTLGEQEAVRLGDERNYQKVLDRLQPYKDKVELHQRNVEALKKEIGGLK